MLTLAAGAEVVGNFVGVQDSQSTADDIEYTVPTDKTYIIQQIFVDSNIAAPWTLRIRPSGVSFTLPLSFTNKFAVYNPPLYVQGGTYVDTPNISGSGQYVRFFFSGLLADSSDLYVRNNQNKFKSETMAALASDSAFQFLLSLATPERRRIAIEESNDLGDWTKAMDALIVKTSEGGTYDVTVPLVPDAGESFYRGAVDPRR